MALKKGKKKDDFFSQIAKEDGLSGPNALKAAPKAAAASAPTSLIDMAPKDKTFVSIVEDLTCVLDKDGTVKKLIISGEMKLAIFDPDNAKVLIKTTEALSNDKSYKCRLHPKINTALYNSEGTLALKDSTKPFPVGSENAPVILKWRLQTAEDSEVPISLNFWPNAEDGKTVVSAEFKMEKEGLTLKDVVITIPCPSSEAPEVTNNDGDYHFDHKTKMLTWTISEISSDNGSGSLEFSIPEVEEEAMYPINIHFTSENTFAKIEVLSINQVDGDEPVDYVCKSMLKTEKYVIE